MTTKTQSRGEALAQETASGDVMNSKFTFRPATLNDCSLISLLQTYAAGGVAEAIVQGIIPGVAATELLGRWFAHATSAYTYRNSTILSVAGAPAGHILLFPFEEEFEIPADLPIPEERLAVMEPFEALPAPNTHYVGSIAVLPEHRRQGLGSALLNFARERARGLGTSEMSLHVFEQNADAVELYKRHGYRVIGRHPVVCHDLIRYTGDLLLMTAPV